MGKVKFCEGGFYV